MLGDALTTTISDLAIGLLIAVGTLVLVFGPLVYLEIRYGGEELEAELEPEVVDPWATLPPKWSPPRAESDLGDVSERRAA